MTQLPSQLMGDDLDLSQQRGDLRLLQASLNLKDKEIKAEKARAFFQLLPQIIICSGLRRTRFTYFF